MQAKTIITCAVTGAFDSVRSNPAVPVTPEQIATSALGAARAGAAIVHIHVREPATGLASMEPAYYREVVARIRDSGVDVILNLTTGAGGRFIPSEDDPLRPAPGSSLSLPQRRIEHVLELRPEICTLDTATLNFGDSPFINTPPHLRVMAAEIRAAGVRPEIEVFDLGHIELAKQLMREGLIDSPPMFQLCLGIPYGAPATVEALVALRGQLPANAHWAAFGISRREFPIAAATVAMGGHIRVGLEDNLYLSKGVLAPDNASLVERAVRICEALNQPVATATEARRILGLAKA